MSIADDAVPIELHMFSPVKSEDITELLVVTAHYHRTGRKLKLWDSVNFGRAWLDNSKCDHGLISLPYLDGPSLEILNSARFYWLIPVTSSEVQYKSKNGIEALESKFEDKQFNYLDPARAAVI